MKTIFKNGVYSRVSNEVGDSQVKHYGFTFVPKKDWKMNVRDFEKQRLEEAKVKKEAELQNAEPITTSKKPYQKSKKS